MTEFFPTFTAHWIETAQGKIFARKGGKGPPLLLIHGFPQTHVEWHKMAGELAQKYTLILPDLPGYGWSCVPKDTLTPSPYSKSEMAKTMIEVMDYFGFVHFACMGHDRGARVAYRLELEHKGRLSQLVLIDILPTLAMWEAIERNTTPANAHWLMLAQPFPLPENEIKKDAVAYQNAKLALWSGVKSLDYLHPLALKDYNTYFNDPSRIHANCEDYRAGATLDRAADERDLAAQNHLTCPVLCLWGDQGIPATGGDVLKEWARFATNLQGQAIKGGHFLPEENAPDVLKAVLAFLK
jgi:haloacetate dehalogenase